MATIEKRQTKDGKTHYRAKIRLKGYPAQTTTHERLTDAKRWAAETEAAMRNGRHFKTIEAKKHTIKDVIERYTNDVIIKKKKSYIKQEAQLKWWDQQIGHKLLADVTPSLIAEHRDKLSNETTYRGGLRSSATVNRYLAAISHPLSIAVKEWGWIEDNPVKKVIKPKEPNGRVRYLEKDDLKKLVEACKESTNYYLYPIVTIALGTGMRHGEIINLQWNQIDLNRKTIILHETKNGERRAVPLSNQVINVLESLKQQDPKNTSLVFPAQKTRITKKAGQIQLGIKPTVIKNAWNTALKKSNIQNFRFHDLRHCAASYLAMSGASLTEIADILGHKSMSMTKRYSHLSDTHKQEVVNRMHEKFLES